jgi:hypothetical protein
MYSKLPALMYVVWGTKMNLMTVLSRYKRFTPWNKIRDFKEKCYSTGKEGY